MEDKQTCEVFGNTYELAPEENGCQGCYFDKERGCCLTGDACYEGDGGIWVLKES